MVSEPRRPTLEQYRAEEALRALSANLMRIIAGAGMPSSIAGEIVDFLQPDDILRDERGTFPSGQEIADALRVERPSRLPPEGEPDTRKWVLYRAELSAEHQLRWTVFDFSRHSCFSNTQVNRRQSDFGATLHRLFDVREERIEEANPARSTSPKGRGK